MALLDWFVLGRPSAARKDLALGTKLTSRQWSAVRMLLELAMDGNTPEFIEAADMGRSAAKNQDHEAMLDCLCRAASMGHVFGYGGGNVSRPDFFEDEWFRCGSLVGRSTRGDNAKAKSLVADRITVPDRPRFDPLPHFDRRTTARYLYPLSQGRRPDDVMEPVPNVQIRASADERLRLFKKLAVAGMLQPVAKDSFHLGFENGMFAVNKDADRDRLVLDSRASNLLDLGQSVWSRAMAAASSVALLYLDDDAVLLSSGEDLKDYFYQFQVNQERTSRNILKGSLSLDDYIQVFGHAPAAGGNGPFYVGLSTLAMGDICAVEYAQCSHASICLKFKVFTTEEIITLRGAVPRGLLQAGIIVDDLVILEHVVRAQFMQGDLQSTEGMKRTANARMAYEKFNLPHNPKKGFVNEPFSRFWGIELDGLKGTLRASSLRMWPTAIITLRVCSLGLATIGLLEALAGTWVSLLGVKRRLFSAMEIVFEPLGIPDQKAVVRLSPEIKSELISFILLGPLAVVNLRAKPADFMVATDASLDAMAAVRADVSPAITREVSRFCLKKGVWSKLLQPMAAWERAHGILEAENETPGDGFSCNPLWDVMSRAFPYSTTWVKHVTRSEHINILEMKALVAEEKRIAERFCSLRVLAGLDSQVSLGSLVKGRASSKAINNILRQSMPYSISSDIQMHYMYCNTKRNRSDGPTRNKDPAPPDMVQPPWVAELPKGKTDSFDAWMRIHCRELVKHEVPFNEIGGPDDVDIRSSRATRDSNYFNSRGGPQHSGVEPRRDCCSGVLGT